MKALFDFLKKLARALSIPVKIAFIGGIFVVLFFPERFGIDPERFTGISFQKISETLCTKPRSTPAGLSWKIPSRWTTP